MTAAPAKQRWFTPGNIIQIVVLVIAFVGMALQYESRVTKLETQQNGILERLSERDRKIDDILRQTSSMGDKFESLFRDYDIQPKRYIPREERRGK